MNSFPALPFMSILHSPHLVGTPVVPLLPEAWLEMVNAKTIDQWSIPVHDAFEVLYETQGGNVTGFIVFQRCPSEVFIRMSYTKPEHRLTGVHMRLFEHLVNLAKTFPGVNRLLSGTFNNNLAMRKAMEKRGSTEYSVFSQYLL